MQSSTANETAETLVNDSVALMRTFSAISNPLTGIGNSRDKTTQVNVNVAARQLNRVELSALAETGVTARAVHQYPEDAGQAWCKIDLGSGNFDPQDILEYWRDLRNGVGGMTVRDGFVLASSLGRQDGDGYLVAGVVDGKESWEPIDRRNIQAIAWVKVMSAYEMRPYKWQSNPLNPEFYVTKDASGKEVLWHRDRVYRFHGIKLLPEGLRRNDGHNLSVIQAMFNSWNRREQSLQSSMLMIINHQLRTLGMKGLNELLKSGKSSSKQGEEVLLKRLLALDMGTSASRTLLHDLENEDVKNLNINYGGVDKIVEKVDDAWIADSDMPRVILLNTIGTTGLTSGEAYQMAMYDWAFRVQGWGDLRWKGHLEHLAELTFLADNSPVKLKKAGGWSVTVPLNLKMTPLQQMELENQAAERSQKLVGIGAIKPIEVRKGYRGTDFNVGIVLDDDDDIESNKPQEELTNQDLETQLKGDAKLSKLPCDEDGQIYFEGEWWTPNQLMRREDGSKAVLAVKEGEVKLIVFDTKVNIEGLRSDTKLSELKRNSNGQVWYRGRWWTPNKPVTSDREGKKKMVLAVKNGEVKLIHFGDSSMQDYTQHRSEKRRANYLARSAGIKDKEGRLTAKDKHSANFWARTKLW